MTIGASHNSQFGNDHAMGLQWAVPEPGLARKRNTDKAGAGLLRHAWIQASMRDRFDRCTKRPDATDTTRT